MLDSRRLIGVEGWTAWSKGSVSAFVLVITIALMPSCATSAGGPGTDVGSLIKALRECESSVEFLELTLDKLFTVLILPPNEEQILVRLMSEKLGLESRTASLAEAL